jgi:HJR/Mrr/RecB family endonuclease
MDDWLTLDQEEPVETFFMENESGDDSLLVHFLKLFDKRRKQKKKKSSDQEEELKSHYNVYIYRVLRYPPTSKDVQDFIIQRN